MAFDKVVLGDVCENSGSVPTENTRDDDIPSRVITKASCIPTGTSARKRSLTASIVAPLASGVNFEFVLGPKPFRFSSKSQVQPDVVVLPRWKNHPSHVTAEPTGPELFVEVATPYSREVDLGIKHRLYAANDVFEYWVVDCVAREVVVSRANEWRPRVETKTLRWQPRRTDRALMVDLPAYFDSLPEFDFSHDASMPWIRRLGGEVEPGQVSTSE